MIWLLTALAGGVGAATRVATTATVDTRLGRPYGTLAVNMIGTAGLVVLLLSPVGADARLILGVGLLGGLTTFSTWMLEGIWLATEESMAAAALHLAKVAVAGVAIAAVSLLA